MERALRLVTGFPAAKTRRARDDGRLASTTESVERDSGRGINRMRTE
jgi:hypothetical protein